MISNFFNLFLLTLIFIFEDKLFQKFSFFDNINGIVLVSEEFRFVLACSQKGNYKTAAKPIEESYV
ncbi:hypothetical protein BpHYR1_021424 [Brachionus plicatilis]|uniref:Uncharacterized protein n=1 Tax=Brachionus plicatilis TaxID=10195 RepID=A0A3M7PTM9_BRAPC|nr:hypothetical protein BpHYR1_021424 [Brachionus plicatilis]